MRKSLKRKRKFERISFKERVIIENRYCIDKKKITDIAFELNRPKSAVSREIGGKPRLGRGRYSAIFTAETYPEIQERLQEGSKTGENG